MKGYRVFGNRAIFSDQNSIGRNEKMTDIHEEKFTGPMVWDAKTAFPNNGIFKLDDTCFAEIESVAGELRANPLPTEALLPEDFDLPACTAVMTEVRQAIDKGTGFAVVDLSLIHI